MNIQWFPGHMTKTKRAMAEDIRLVDLVLELVDARVPFSSKNPDMDDLARQKPRLLVYNKIDLADPLVTQQWQEVYREQGIFSVSINSVTGKGIPQLLQAVDGLMAERQLHDRERGIKRNVKMMVVGVPNVGKSSFINKLAGRASAKTGDRPGITRGKQWIRLQQGYELLDTPGILWPKFEDQRIGFSLACTGAIKDDVVDVEELACFLLEYLKTAYPEKLQERYRLQWQEPAMGYDLLEEVCRKRGFLQSGGHLDTRRGAMIVLDEFRGGKLGAISLEKPEDVKLC